MPKNGHLLINFLELKQVVGEYREYLLGEAVVFSDESSEVVENGWRGFHLSHFDEGD